MKKRKGEAAVKAAPKRRSRARGRFPLAKFTPIDYEEEFRLRKIRLDYGDGFSSETCSGCEHALANVTYRNGTVRKLQCAVIGVGDYDAAEVSPKSRCRRYTFKRL